MRKLNLSFKVFLGFCLGIALGLIFKEKSLIMKPLGELFLKLIQMIVVPLIFFSITSGVASIGDIKKLKRIGSKTLLYYIITTLIAGAIGLSVAHIVKPGKNVDIESVYIEDTEEIGSIPSVSDTILSLFPSNPFKAFTEGNLMQVIIFSLFLGVSSIYIGDKSKTIRIILNEGTDIMHKMTEIVMEFSPIGVAALMASTIGEFGLKIFGPLGKFILTDYLGLITVILVMYILMIKFIAKIPLSYFFKKILKIWTVTASTTSSSGSLPTTIETAVSDFGISEELASFTLPIGATMNMNGAVVYYSAAIIFVSQIYNIDISFTKQIIIIIMTTMISVGSPGIPGGGIVMTIMLLNTLGLPLDIVGMIAGIYRIIDMGHTTMNVTGDIVSTLCIARSENMIDDSVIFNNKS